MTPGQAIAALDRQIAVHGQSIKIRRGGKEMPNVTLTIDGFVRGYKPDEIVAGSGISQRDSKVIMSPTDLAGWPAPPPKENDWCEIDGVFRAIVAFQHIKLANTLVRVELQVKG